MSKKASDPNMENCQGACNVEDRQSLPESIIRKRIKAMKGLEQNIVLKKEKLDKDIFELNVKLDEVCKDLFEKRRNIISGEYEPTAEECEYPSEEANEKENQTKLEKANYPVYNENVKGVPEFWLTVFKNSAILEAIIHDNDEPLLSHLEDIKEEGRHESGFILEFHFSENEYFTNKVLTKFYETIYSFQQRKDYIFGFEELGTIICKGCKIDWKDGKNITLKTVKKLEVKTDGIGFKIITKTINSDSFFNFFNPPAVPTKPSCNDQAIIDLLNEDFELGKYFKNRIIPKATLYYTGETYVDYDYYENWIEPL